MKILDINLKHSEITVKTENLNDLWTLYNVIDKGDKAISRTQRRVVIKEGTKGVRKAMKLKLEVENVSFHEFSNRLRIKGKILEGPEDYVSYGTFHTFNIEISHKLTIIKEKWLNQEIRRLKDTSKFESNFIILFIAIETGLANLALVTNFSYKRIATIKKNIPGKRYKQEYRNKALSEFYIEIKKVLEENLKNLEVNLIILCGPGNSREHLLNNIKKSSGVDYIDKIETFHASSGTESGIRETLKSKKLTRLKDKVKILQETDKIESIMHQFAEDPDFIVIGIDEVSQAAKQGAIKQLMLADILIRGTSKKSKLKIEEIITNVEKSGGEVDIMSSESIPGEHLVNLGSIIGILRYKF